MLDISYTPAVLLLTGLLLLGGAATVTSQDAASGSEAAPDQAARLAQQATHPNPRMRFKVLDSRYRDRDALWAGLSGELDTFDERLYESLKPLILEQDIPALQRAVRSGQLSYEKLVKFYLYRIRQLESDRARSLNALIAINPEAVRAARGKDRALAAGLEVNEQSMFGIPVLLKDNIGTLGMPTTAGAVVMAENRAADAFVTRRLRANGAVILGKANLSEWAYYFCDGCPLGYSALGGQTLNPYGRMVLESGGSSSGSAVAVAANLVAVAVGSETSGSILSPASLNSAVGLKPTTGLLSRQGVIPISGTLDTPGPIARSVGDAVVLFNAMTGYDRKDPAMPLRSADADLLIRKVDLAGRRLGVIAGLESEPLVAGALESVREAGAEVLVTALPAVELPAFAAFLGAEMKQDLARYLQTQADPAVGVALVEEIVMFNSADPANRAPYGQALFDAMVRMRFSGAQIDAMRDAIRAAGAAALEGALDNQQVEVLLSINNRHAALAAAANFPALTLPLGIGGTGEPLGLTLIAPSYTEQTLVDIALALEALLDGRVSPPGYQ